MSARALLTLVALSAACSYDLDVLKGRRVDGGLDASVDTPVIDSSTDRAPTDVATDIARDVIADAGPSRDASMGTCTAATATPTAVTASPSGVTVISASTSGGGSAPEPSCPTSVVSNSTRVYRYEVQSGPRLVVTTNTSLCGGHDTILAAYFACDTGGSRPVGSAMTSCNDDDNVNLCVGCTSAGVDAGCGNENSTLDLSGLVPHDVVYLTVSSFGSTGSFRMAIAENGLVPQVPPAASTGQSPANRCMCPPSGAPMTSDLPFPRMGDINQLGTTSRSIFGARTLPFTRVTGVSARLAFTRYSVDTSGSCAVGTGALAALDLLIGNTVVATGRLSVGSGAGGFVTIPLTSFALVVFTSTTGIPITYQIRNVDPTDVSCVSLEVDLNAPNTVTLYGTN